MPKKNILIIEDETDLRELYATQLESEFNLIEAKDGAEGLTIALSRKPDLILLDLLIPKMDGMTMLRRLRRDKWGKGVKVIILTNLSASEKLSEAVKDGLIESGVNDYVIKSDLTTGVLIKKVKEKLET